MSGCELIVSTQQMQWFARGSIIQNDFEGMQDGTPITELWMSINFHSCFGEGAHFLVGEFIMYMTMTVMIEAIIVWLLWV